MGRRISKEFLHPSILEGVNNKIGNLSELETGNKADMVSAINELFAKLDNSSEEELELARMQLIDILQEEGVEVTEEDNMDSLIAKVEEEFDNNKQQLVDVLTSKGIDCSTSNSFDELIGNVDDIKPHDYVLMNNSGTISVTFFGAEFTCYDDRVRESVYTFNFNDERFIVENATLNMTHNHVSGNVQFELASVSLTQERDGVVIKTIISKSNILTDVIPMGNYVINDLKVGDVFRFKTVNKGSYSHVERFNLSLISKININM